MQVRTKISRRAIRVASATVALLLTAGAAQAAPPGTGWDLVFADEFSGTTLDTVKWSAASPGWTMPNSASTASASQVTLAGGNLKLNATRTSATAFSSGSISSYQKYNFDGGYVEARIDLPSTPGSWPAFWGLFDGWPPEMDIMEYPLTTDGGTNGYANNAYHTAFHYTNAGNVAASGAGKVTTAANLGATGYHTFAADWTSDASVRFYLDGNQVSSFTNASVAQMQSMYMILDYAVGGWPGTPSTAQWAVGASDQTLVDWVRIWQKRPTGASESSAWAVNGGGGWDAGTSWTGIVPKYGGQQATFGRVGAAAASNVTWTATRAVGSLIFDSDTAYTLAGGANASLQMIGSGANAAIRVLATNTVDQTINSRVELYDATDVSNDSAKALVLNGVIMGDGALNIDGAGVVQFANNNTYAGDTIVDTGTQGPAVARVTRSRAFGTGVVRLGPNGNLTTARIEIQDSRSLPNAIVFGGRNNATVGLQNLSGNNVFSGTVSASTGGGSYLIQSDAGLMSFTGADGGGVALTASAGGSRTFTLGGAGNGAVTGAITNGAANLAIAKAGAGTWTFSGTNTFTGGINVAAGTLVADSNAALGAGSVTIAAGTLAVAATRDVAGLTGLALANGSTLSLGNGSSLALASGAFTIGNVTIDLNHAFDALGSYTLVDGANAANTIGQVAFANVNSAYQYSLSLVGNDAILNVGMPVLVPEPATLAAVAVACFSLTRRRRRD